MFLDIIFNSFVCQGLVEFYISCLLDFDVFLEEDWEVLRKEVECQVLVQFEKVKIKLVVFVVWINVGYNLFLGDEVFVQGVVIIFEFKDFLYIKEKYNNDWWIGWLVKEGCEVGFIFSFVKLNSFCLLQEQKLCQNCFSFSKLGDNFSFSLGDVVIGICCFIFFVSDRVCVFL